jgi:hypothetical protein
MKKSIKTLILGLLLIITLSLSEIKTNTSQNENQKIEEEGLEKFKEYKTKEFKSLLNLVKESDFSLELENAPFTINLKSKDEIFLIAENNIPVIKNKT